MRTAKVFVVTEDELRKELMEFAKGIASDSVGDLLTEGNEGNPYVAEIIEKGGFNRMRVDDLIELSEPWADFVLDTHAENHPEQTVDDQVEGIIVIDKHQNQQSPYRLLRSHR